jgi:hypothetical protein
MPADDEFEERWEDLKKEIDQRKRFDRVEVKSSRLFRLNRVLALLTFFGVLWVTWEGTPSDLLRSIVIAALAAATILFVVQLVIALVIARVRKG